MPKEYIKVRLMVRRQKTEPDSTDKIIMDFLKEGHTIRETADHLGEHEIFIEDFSIRKRANWLVANGHVPMSNVILGVRAKYNRFISGRGHSTSKPPVKPRSLRPR